MGICCCICTVDAGDGIGDSAKGAVAGDEVGDGTGVVGDDFVA